MSERKRKQRPERVYYLRGSIERGSDYHWCDGYSAEGPDGGVLYPWSTRRKCQSEAKRDGFKAVFQHPARVSVADGVAALLGRRVAR